MLHDQSATKCTQVYSSNSQSFQNGRDRNIVIRNDFNTEIGMGGTNCDKIRFEIKLLVETDEDIVDMIKSQKDPLFNPADDPREFRTLHDTRDALMPTALPSRGMSRMGSPGFFKMRYVKVKVLGVGTYGVVSKAIDIDTGVIMAVKSNQRRGLSWSPQEYQKIRREAETMQKIAHEHIIDMINYQGWEDSCIEFFMGLKDGSLADIINANEFDDKKGSRVLEHMLAALDCLAWNKILHRDVKPQNILYTRTPESNYDFQLADFGECKMTSSARSCKGTLAYMAPEVLDNSGVLLTPKVDT
ncbi:hypothetical protein N7G274_003188 [Stereocaulon virgatum]|uniref:mitogen-activated protein kinase n=1 Tax=Stereocaulon virgatum TaxID=373712 RepID=A0ABR4AM23_9LECA